MWWMEKNFFLLNDMFICGFLVASGETRDKESF